MEVQLVSLQRSECRHRLPFEVGQHPATLPSSPQSVQIETLQLATLGISYPQKRGGLITEPQWSALPLGLMSAMAFLAGEDRKTSRICHGMYKLFLSLPVDY